MADALSREEHRRRIETEIREGLQAGIGGCGGMPHEVGPARRTKSESTRAGDRITLQGNIEPVA